MVSLRRLLHAAEVGRWRLSRALRLPPLEMLPWSAVAFGAVALLAAVAAALGLVEIATTDNDELPRQAFINFWVYLAVLVVSALVTYALTPTPDAPEAGTAQVPVVEDGKGIIRVYGTVWVDDSIMLGWKPTGTDPIRKKVGSGIFKKRQTTGHWYRYALHFGWCQGPIDALLEIRGGDRTAWRGEMTQSGQIHINAPELWGGDEKEGGIEGVFDVMLGEPDQQPNAYLAGELGPQQSAYRGRASGVFRGGRWGAMSPYPKPAAFKLRRILKGWDADTPWYPETAVIRGRATGLLQPTSLYITLDISGSMAGSKLAVLKEAMSIVFDALSAHVASSSVPLNIRVAAFSDDVASITRMGAKPTDFGALREFVDDLPAGGGTNAMAAYGRLVEFMPSGVPQNNVVVCVSDGAMSNVGDAVALVGDMLDQTTPPYSTGTGDAVRMFGVGIGTVGSLGSFNNSGQPVPVIDGESAAEMADMIMAALYSSTTAQYMNPAHILYDSLTSQKMQGEPVAEIDDDSFRVAANRLYGEGFGLCTSYDPALEAIEDFQQRICNVIGGTLGRSHATGLWYLDLVRGEFELEDLPVITDDDILEWSGEPSTLDDAVSQMIVAWRDPDAKEDRVTAPVHSLGAIQAFGVISQTATYREVPSEELALRIAARDLQAKATPLERFPLVCKRTASQVRAGKLFRLQAPRRGIADMVCLAGSMDYGTTRASAVRIEALQSVFGLPQVAYVVPEPGIDTSPPDAPEPAPAQRAFEMPYVDLVGNLSSGDLAALAPTSGFVALVAARPEAGMNYMLATAANGSEWERVEEGDWSPHARIVEAADLYTTTFTLSDGDRLERVATGTAAMWGNEIVRVDAIDPEAGTITLGRGCADTVPARKSPGERIWFYDAWAAGDPTEYVEGEEVGLKALTRVPSALLNEALAPTSEVVLASRAARPYPPGDLRIEGALEHEFTGAVAAGAKLTWAHRDRLVQADQLVDWSAPPIGPELGVTYRVDLHAVPTSGVPDPSPYATADAGATGSWDYVPGEHPDPPAAVGIQFRVYAVRDGLDSWQASQITAPLLLPPTGLTAVGIALAAPTGVTAERI